MATHIRRRFLLDFLLKMSASAHFKFPPSSLTSLSGSHFPRTSLSTPAPSLHNASLSKLFSHILKNSVLNSVDSEERGEGEERKDL